MEPKNKMRGTVEEGEVVSVAEVCPVGVYPSPVPDPAVPERNPSDVGSLPSTSFKSFVRPMPASGPVNLVRC